MANFDQRFPRARHFIQRAEWEDANGNIPELAGAYYPDDFAPLHAAGLVQLIEGDAEVVPGISTQVTDGHTRGHQIIHIQSAANRPSASPTCVPQQHICDHFGRWPTTNTRSRSAITSRSSLMKWSIISESLYFLTTHKSRRPACREYLTMSGTRR